MHIGTISRFAFIAAGGTMLWLGAALACDQLNGPRRSVSPCQRFEVHGFSFYSTPEPVRLSWENGAEIAVVAPGDDGAFTYEISAPGQPGVYKVLAHKMSGDPVPAVATVVVAPSGRAEGGKAGVCRPSV